MHGFLLLVISSLIIFLSFKFSFLGDIFRIFDHLNMSSNIPTFFFSNFPFQKRKEAVQTSWGPSVFLPLKTERKSRLLIQARSQSSEKVLAQWLIIQLVWWQNPFLKYTLDCLFGELISILLTIFWPFVAPIFSSSLSLFFYILVDFFSVMFWSFSHSFLCTAYKYFPCICL